MKKFGLFWLALSQASVVLSQPVSERMVLDVGTSEVYLDISGPSTDAPLILYLHGGPGNVVTGLLPFQMIVGRQLEKDFLVVYLHQRGAGKSSSVPASEQTVFAHISDVEKVVDFLTERYDQDQVHLIGHSWGAILAALYADKHGEDVQKLVLISAVMNVRSQFRDSRKATLEWARAEGISDAIAELSGVDASFDTPHDTELVSRWAIQPHGGIGRRFDMAALTEKYDLNTEYPDWRERTSDISVAMLAETIEIDLDDAITSFDTPALFVSGALDTIVPEASMRRDYTRYGGAKRFVLLQDSHHLPFVDEPDELIEAVRAFLQE